MKKVMVWFLLSCKRYIKKLSFLLILLLLPLVILAVDKGQGSRFPAFFPAPFRQRTQQAVLPSFTSFPQTRPGDGNDL